GQVPQLQGADEHVRERIRNTRPSARRRRRRRWGAWAPKRRGGFPAGLLAPRGAFVSYTFDDVSLVAGVDLGGTKIQTVVLKNRKVVGSDRIETPRTGAEAVLGAIVESIKSSVQDAGGRLSELTAAGV